MSSVCLGFQACNKPAPVKKFKRTGTLSFVSCFIRYYITSAPKCVCSLNIVDNLIKLSVTNGFMSTCLHPFCRFLLPKSVQNKYADIQNCSLCLQPCITPSLQVSCLKLCWFCVVVQLHNGTLLSDAGC